MTLPNAENAVVDVAKLRDYCLNHPEGKHKARVFKEKPGITKDDAERLRQVILEAMLESRSNGTGIHRLRPTIHCKF
jgi:hypothetical protein